MAVKTKEQKWKLTACGVPVETSETYARLPSYLKKYVVSQNYDKYTSKDQAVWRFIMRQSRDFFTTRAHSIWLSGVKDTGIPFERIPRIEDMDRALQKYGWGACCICGFIPPAAFLDFLARKVLPIAADMRSADHIAYTPAPDIVHEAAGHAPIIADAGYRDYLIHYSKLARKAIFSDEDIKLYEAIRLLSDIKENPDSTPFQIEEAQQNLNNASAKITWVSEASQVARMSWWTIEYGMIGGIADPKIYGAGLLSSIGESLACFDEKVKKIPLSLECINQGYDITEPQPQLFVAKDFQHMNRVLLELEESMAFKKGGKYGLELAKKSKTITTTMFESSISVSGHLVDILYHEEKPAYLKWQGKVQIAFEETELPGQGILRHPGGFSTPIGRLRGTNLTTSMLTKNDLASIGIELGANTYLQFKSGVQVDGTVRDIQFKNNFAILITWENCTVKWAGELLYHPEWGPFDMPLISEVRSVYGGPSDWEAFGDYDVGKASSVPSRQTPFSTAELRVQELFSTIRQFRENPSNPPIWSNLESITQEICQSFSNEWLLAIELLELVKIKFPEKTSGPLYQSVKTNLLNLDEFPSGVKKIVERGIKMAEQND